MALIEIDEIKDPTNVEGRVYGRTTKRPFKYSHRIRRYFKFVQSIGV